MLSSTPEDCSYEKLISLRSVYRPILRHEDRHNEWAAWRAYNEKWCWMYHRQLSDEWCTIQEMCILNIVNWQWSDQWSQCHNMLKLQCTNPVIHKYIQQCVTQTVLSLTPAQVSNLIQLRNMVVWSTHVHKASQNFEAGNTHITHPCTGVMNNHYNYDLHHHVLMSAHWTATANPSECKNRGAVLYSLPPLLPNRSCA